jgi:hypothetical protein
MSDISDKAEANYTLYATRGGATEDEISDKIDEWNKLDDRQVDLINTYLETDALIYQPTDPDGSQRIFDIQMGRIEGVIAIEADDFFEENLQQAGTQAEMDIAAIEEAQKNKGVPRIGAYDASESRFSGTGTMVAGFADKREIFLADDEEQIVADVMYMIQNLPPEEQKLMAMEMASAGFYDRFGGFDIVFDSNGNLDLTNYGQALAQAFYYADQWKATGAITTAEVGGQVIKAPSQQGLGISLAYNILTGQSGLSAQEIVSQYNERKKEEDLQGVTYYDPAYIMKTVDDISKVLLGQGATVTQKNKFADVMVRMVEHHAQNNIAMTEGAVQAQAELFLGTEADNVGEPEKMAAAKKGSAVQALRKAVLGR